MDRTTITEESVCLADRLLDAAERVVARDGVANLTLEAVANEAGVSKGGLLYHFRSKSALVTAIVERLANRCQTEQERALAEAPAEAGAFTRAYVNVRTGHMDGGKQTVHAAILAAAGTDPQFLDPIRKRILEWQSRFEADGLEPEVAMIVRLAIEGLCFCRLLGLPAPEGELRVKVVERLIAMTRGEGNCTQEKQR